MYKKITLFFPLESFKRPIERPLKHQIHRTVARNLNTLNTAFNLNENKEPTKIKHRKQRDTF